MNFKVPLNVPFHQPRDNNQSTSMHGPIYRKYVATSISTACPQNCMQTRVCSSTAQKHTTAMNILLGLCSVIEEAREKTLQRRRERERAQEGE